MTPTAAQRAAGAGRWLRDLRRAFDARALRERALLAAAGAAAVFMLCDALWLAPALRAWNSAQAQRQAADTQAAALQTAARRVAEQQAARQRGLQAELDALRLRVRGSQAWMRDFEATLVGPERMLPLLEQMLARHGQVRVRALKSLGHTDLLAGTGGADAPARAASRAPTTAAPPALYRHGIELTLEGSFGDLMNYVAALEATPQRLLWGAMSFRVEQHPRAVLTLQLYTLSRERHWIEI